MPTGSLSGSRGSCGGPPSTLAPSEDFNEFSSRMTVAGPEAVTELLNSCGPNPSLDHLCRAFGRLLELDKVGSTTEALEKVSEMAMRNAAELSGQGLASVAMKTARTDCGAGTRPMMDVLVREVIMRMDAATVADANKRLSALQLSEVVTACALACYHPGEPLLQTTLREATAHMQELPTQYLVQIAWSMATLGHVAAAPLLEAVIGRTASAPLDQVTARDREQLFWAAAVLDVASSGTLELLGKLMSSLQPTDLDRESQPRLFQAHMALERLAPSATAAGAPAGNKEEGTRTPVQLLPGEVLAHAEAAWRCALADAPETEAQQEASAALTELGLNHAAAVFTNGGLLKPDLVVMTPSARVALTMDQPSAFCINPPHRPLGHTILTWRLLVLHDWQVLSMPFYKWQALGSQEARVNHLRTLLMPASAAPVPRARQAVSGRSSSAIISREGLRGLQTPTGQRPYQPPLDTGVSQRSLSSADLGALGGAPPGRAATVGGDSAPAPLELAGGKSLDGVVRGHADPSALMRALLAAQGSNPFGRQAGTSDQQQQVESLGSMNLSDPGSLRRLSVGSGLPSGFLPRPSGLHPMLSVGAGSTNPSDQSTSLTTLSTESSRTVGQPPWLYRESSGATTTTSGESVRTIMPPAWGAGDAGGPGIPGAADGGAMAAGLGAAETRESSSGTAQPLLPEPPEGPAWSMQDLAARLASLSRGETAGASSLGLPMALSQPSDPYYSDAAAAMHLPQSGLHPTLPGVSAGLAAGGYPGDTLAAMVPPGGGPGAMPLSAQQHAALSQILSPGSAAGSMSSLGTHESGANLRQLWQAVAGLDPPQHQEAVNPAELKRIIEGLPLETSAVAAVEWRLGQLDPPQFAALLTELARDNHAFRAWQLFDWVRALPEGHALRRLCDAHTYTTMITLCGPWQQLRRALQLVAEMRARSLECGAQAYSALLHAAVKCGETDLAVDVYGQMGREGMPRDRSIYITLIEMFVKLGRVNDALSALADLHALGEPPDTHLYNLVLVAATKMGPPRFALTVYHRMVLDGAQPNTKTFTALIGSFGKLGSVSAALDVIGELLSHEPGGVGSSATYAALMAACEKAGQGDLALALFEKMAAQNVQPDVGIFNSMIAACAHGGEYSKARHMFESMAEHGCEPDAVTYANLIRAFKKGGQWCAALDTFEAMLASGSRPHAAVYSSIIDVLWQTGIPWAQAKALHLFNSAVENGSLPAAAESCKKGTLKLDLQSLTVGVAVVSMGAWLLGARAALLQDAPTSLDAARKLAVVNGLGEHSRAQGHSAAVKEAVSASLLGCKAPFRLVQDHSRSGRLEASTLALRKWLFSDQFDRYLSLVEAGAAEAAPDALQPTSEYMGHEEAEKARTAELWQRVVRYEAMHPISLKVLHANPGAYLQQRKGLVAAVLHYASALGVPQEVAHSAVTLMDRVMMSGVHMTDQFQTLFICACLRLAALHENAAPPSGLAVSSLTDFPDMALERMESNITAVLRSDMECIAAVHCLKVYCQRLGCDLADGAAVRQAVGCAFALATEALADMAVLQFPPSLTAAAILVAARRAQGSVPFWPSVLAQLTGYTEASSPPFASAIAHAGRLCSKLYTSIDPTAAAYMA